MVNTGRAKTSPTAPITEHVWDIKSNGPGGLPYGKGSVSAPWTANGHSTR